MFVDLCYVKKMPKNLIVTECGISALISFYKMKSIRIWFSSEYFLKES